MESTLKIGDHVLISDKGETLNVSGRGIISGGGGSSYSILVTFVDGYKHPDVLCLVGTTIERPDKYLTLYQSSIEDGGITRA